jgi:GT2 family glycosyltransferase
MISVVFSTRSDNPEYQKHIKETCGVKDLEIIQVVNNSQYSLTEVYNKGLKDSNNNIVAFIHDDLILPKNWGKKMLDHFNNSDYGILGVAGTTDLPESGMWWEDKTKMVGIVKHQHEGRTWSSEYSNDFGKEIIETVIVDGLFFVVDKTKIKKSFNEEIKGFHLYDIDFTFNNHINGVKVGVIFDVRITHKSIGQTNKQWEENKKQFVGIYKEFLPKKLNVGLRYDTKKVDKLKRYPKVSVIIPTKGNVNLLTNCVNSLFDKDDYLNMEVLIADTGSTDEEKTEIKTLTTKYNGVKLIEYDYYNFAKINNDVVKNHISEDTELILFCNNDIELVNDGVTRMVDFYLKNKMIGTIGVRLHFGDNSIQHSGINLFLGNDRRIHVSHHGLRSYYKHHKGNKEVFGNTAAFMMIKKQIFKNIGGFNESYKECFEDVHLNVECLNLNLKNYLLSDVVCYHYESQTRNKNEDKWKNEAEDYTNRIIPFIIKNKKTYKYFDNISEKDVTMIMSETLKKIS